MKKIILTKNEQKLIFDISSLSIEDKIRAINDNRRYAKKYKYILKIED